MAVQRSNAQVNRSSNLEGKSSQELLDLAKTQLAGIQSTKDAMFSGAPATEPTSGSGTTSNSAFMDALTSRLLGQADVISSQDTQIESAFNQAQQGIQTAADKNTQRIESQFGRESGYLQQQAQDAFSNFSESRTGFATQMTAFRQLVQTTDKELKDLEQRKQELILQGEGQAASQIAGLQLQKLQYQQKAQQSVFDNLLGIGQFQQGRERQQLAERQFGLQQDQFALSTQQFALQESNAAFTRLSQLKEMGALGGLTSDQRFELEQQAGLPTGVVEEIAKIPPQQEIRAVGDTLIAIDPRTLQSKVIYSGGSGGSGGVNIGGTDVSWMTASVLNGMQRLEDLTTTDQSKVRQEMTKLGFGTNNPPEWFKDKINGAQRRGGLIDIDPTLEKQEWNKYRESFVYGPRYINTEYITSKYDSKTLENDAENFGFDDTSSYLKNLMIQVEELRARGLRDDEITDTLSL